jgi:hypothetical protein
MASAPPKGDYSAAVLDQLRRQPLRAAGEKDTSYLGRLPTVLGPRNPQECHPPRSVLGGDDVDTQHLAVTIGVHAGGDHCGHTDYPFALSHLVEQAVQPDVGVGPGIEWPFLNSATLALRDLAISDAWDLDIPSPASLKGVKPARWTGPVELFP